MVVIDNTNIQFGFVKLVFPKMGDTFGKLPSRFFGDPHGPAMKTDCFREFTTRLFASKLLADLCGMTFDRVLAIKCLKWPRIAAEWKTRNRSMCWKTNHIGLVETVAASGCHLVTKSRQILPDIQKKWRYSFSQAEQILLHTWTPVQMYVYHILKIIMKNMMIETNHRNTTNRQPSPKARIPEVKQSMIFCSYSMKTLMLWKCEEEPDNFWEDSSLDVIIESMLMLFAEWLVAKNCPNYFIRKLNLWNDCPNWVNVENQLEYIVSLCGSRIVKKVISDYPIVEEREFLPQELNGATLRSLLNLLGYIIRDVPAITGMISVEKYDNLFDGIYKLYDGLAYQQQYSEKCDQTGESSISCTNDLLRKAENAFEKVCEFWKINDSEQVFFPASFLQLSIKECFSKLIKYLISNVYPSCANGRSGNPMVSNISGTDCKFDRHIEMNQHKLPNAFLASILSDVPLFYKLLGICYRANLYYLYSKNYTRAIEMCNEGLAHIERPKCLIPELNYENLPIVISSRLAFVYDNLIQTLLGFIILQKSVMGEFQSTKEYSVAIAMPPPIFLYYIRWRSQEYLKVRSRRNKKKLSSKFVSTFVQTMYRFCRTTPTEVYENVIFGEYDNQLAHQANFYYACAEDYARSIGICDYALHRIMRRLCRETFLFEMRTGVSSIYDADIQQCFGFLMLLEFILRGSNTTDDCHFTVYLPHHIFIRYIRVRCFQHLKCPNNERTSRKKLKPVHSFMLLSVLARFIRDEIPARKLQEP